MSNLRFEGIYDAETVSRVLDLPCGGTDSVPGAGELIVYYGGWSLQDLSESPAGKRHMMLGPGCYVDQWIVEPGYYRVLFPVPKSNAKSWTEQVNHLKTIGEGWQPVPATVAATALVVHLAKSGTALLQNDVVCRCADSLLERGCAVVLLVREGRVVVSGDWGGSRYQGLWLAGYRKL